tara:strand:+ start:522 stop:752 length:231 start_codon:yes stop_codon:yes gene_type:complete
MNPIDMRLENERMRMARFQSRRFLALSKARQDMRLALRKSDDTMRKASQEMDDAIRESAATFERIMANVARITESN